MLDAGNCQVGAAQDCGVELGAGHAVRGCEVSLLALLAAGNRRKEQNVVRKSVGFNWGPAAVSTSYWTGVRLCDLLAHCGVHKTSQGARYVCFRGVQKELPQARPATLAASCLCKPCARLAVAHPGRAVRVPLTQLQNDAAAGGRGNLQGTSRQCALTCQEYGQ